MKIYFAGAIRGGRDDQQLYFQIIQELKKYGVVLSEHVGADSLSSMGEQNLSETEIFERDLKWLAASDLFIAEVSKPSFGVGYEIAIAEKSGKPILCFYRKNSPSNLSAMIRGNPALKIFDYENIDDFRKMLKEVSGTAGIVKIIH
jgi:nucleoside 2-deoxyribosyltransferase